MKRIVIILFILFMGLNIMCHAGTIPQLINYQGNLTTPDNGIPFTGSKKFEFYIYDAAIGGTLIWGPQIFNSVPVIQGTYNIILGTTDSVGRSIADAFSEAQRFIAVTIDDGEEIKPRQQVLSSPYTIHAGVADYADQAGHAIIADKANHSESANKSNYAESANKSQYSDQSGHASTANTANTSKGLNPGDITVNGNLNVTGTINGKHTQYADCYDHNWVLSFDNEGWSTCKEGYFMVGLYRNTCNELFCIEYARCCRVK